MRKVIFTHQDHKGDEVEFEIVSVHREGYIYLDNVPVLRVSASNNESTDKSGDIWGVVDIPLARIPELINALAISYRELTGEYPLAPKADTKQERT